MAITNAYLAKSYGMYKDQSFKRMLEDLNLMDKPSKATGRVVKKEKVDEAIEKADNIVKMYTDAVKGDGN